MTESHNGKKSLPPPEYVPSDSEQKLLDVILDPFHRMASVSKQCEVAGISRQTYYYYMKRPDFRAHYAQLCKELVKENAAQLINIGLREAKRGGSAGFGYWRELSKMAGVIEDEKINLVATGEVVHRVVFVRPEDDEE